MSKNYFPNPGNQCFSSSLANLLVELGDRNMAEVVFMKCRNNPFWSPDLGVPSAIVTRMVSDLTCQKYEGTIFIEIYSCISDQELTRLIRSTYGEKTDEILGIYYEEREKGRIKTYNGITDFNIPAIVMVSTKNHQQNHFMVYAGGTAYIDNGKRIRGPSIKDVDFPGVLEVRLND